MNQNVFENISTSINTEEKGIANLFFILRDEDSVNKGSKEYVYKVRKTEISHDISKALFENFKKGVNIINKDKTKIVEYSVSLNDDEYIQEIASGEVPNAEEIKEGILNPELLDVLSDKDIKSIWAYAVLIRFGNRKAIYFRKYSKGKVLKKGFSNALLFKEGNFNTLDNYDVFRLDNYIDCIYYEGKFYVIQNRNFEQIFGYDVQYMNVANKNIQSFADSVLEAEGTELLLKLIESDSNKRRKLAGITSDVINKYQKIDVVRQTVNDYDLDIEINNDHKVIVKEENAQTIIKMFNDDYVRSEATEIRYDATSKRRIGKVVKRKV